MRSRQFAGIALTACLLFSCQSTDDAGTNTSDLHVTTANEPVGANCAAGGKRIEITKDGVTSTVYVRHGLDGDEISVTDAGEQCLHGGSVIQVGSADPIFDCNGKDGAETVVMDAVEAGEDCAYGGVSLRVGEGDPIFLCNGPPGGSGAEGKSATVATEPAGDNCPRGGVKVQVGNDVRYVCNGDALVWQNLTADAQGQPNAAYVADLVLTLPANSALRLGDVMRVVNTGPGAVDLKPNAGQTFQHAPGALASGTSTFVARESNRNWISAASSADGGKLVAADKGEQLYFLAKMAMSSPARPRWWS